MTAEPSPAALRPDATAASALALAEAEEHAALGLTLLREGRVPQALVMLRGAVAFGDRRPGTVLNLALAEDESGDAARGHALMREVA